MVKILKKYTTILGFLFFVSSPSLLSQHIPFENNSLHFEFYDKNEGLPFKPITSMYQDQNGYIWFGSEWGLCRFNGYDFQIFSQKYITKIAGDTYGNLWVGTSEGLLQFDSTRQHTTNHINPAYDEQEQDVNFINTFVIGDKGLFWLGTRAGLVQYNTNQGTYKLYNQFPIPPHVKNPWLTHVIFQLVQDQNGMLWIGMDRGLLSFNPITEKFNYHSFQFDFEGEETVGLIDVHQMILGGNNRLWLRGSFCGLASFNVETKQFHRHVSTSSIKNSAYFHPMITTLLESQDGVIWYGTRTSLYRYLPSTSSLVSDVANPGREGSLSHELIYSLLEEKSGAIWVSTENGLNRYDPYRNQFRTLLHDPKNENSLSANNVLSICEGLDGALWIGTLNGGLNRYDPDARRFTHYRHDPSQADTISEDAITALSADKKGMIWIGTWNSGLCKLDTKTGTVTRYPFVRPKDSPPNPTYSVGNTVRAILPVHENEIWIGMEGGGVNILDQNTGTFSQYRSLRDQNGDLVPFTLNNDAIQSFHQSKDGEIWVGTGGQRYEGNGLNRFIPAANHFEQFLNFPSLKSKPNRLWINSIDEDNQDRLWLATNYGLFQMTGRLDDYHWYTQQHGFQDRDLRSVLCSDDGYIWCSTAHSGLTRFQPETGNILLFNEQNGIQDLAFHHDAGLIGKDGTIYFGGTGGVTYLPKGTLTLNPYSANLLFDQIVIDNELYPHTTNPSDAPIALKHWQNSLSVSYALLNYTMPRHTQYKYRLLGLEDDWSSFTTNREVQFAHLPPGKYAFEVQAKDYAGTESRVSSFPFVIHPPFWQLAWFQTASISLLMVGLYGGVQWRLSSVQKINRRLESEVRNRTSLLRIERDHIRDILHNSPVLILEIQPNGDLSLLNPVAEERFGVKSNDVIGEKWWKLASDPNDRDRLEAMFYELKYEDLFITELPITFRTGKTRNIVWNCVNHNDEDGNVSHSVIFGNDITEHFEKKVIETSNREQQKIGREIHDSICQSLAGMGFMCETLVYRQDHMKKQDADIIRKLRDNMLKLTDQSHRLARGLYLQELEHGLDFALNELAISSQNLFALPCHFISSGHIPITDFERGTHLFRIVQEAVSNAAKYSMTKSITITSSFDNGFLSLTVQDDGIGFQTNQPKKGMGIDIMRFRARMIDAKLEINSSPNQGTTVTCTSTL